MSDNSVVTLIIESRRFDLPLSKLTRYPDTMLGRMFTNNQQSNFVKKNDLGEYELSLGIPAEIFEIILGFYLHGIVYCPPSLPLLDIKEACDYLMIPFDSSTIRCDNLGGLLHELTNCGARIKFDEFLNKRLLRALLNAAKRGDRECHVVILRDTDCVEWDDADKPYEYKDGYHVEVIHDTEMCKFFGFGDNRHVAKQVLEMRGFKRVKINHDDHPTTRDRIRKYPSRRSEVLYNYIYRPFLHMSWERDENKSRHVDFQCVRSRSVISLNEANADPPSAIRAQTLSSAMPEWHNLIFVDENDHEGHLRSSITSSVSSLEGI